MAERKGTSRATEGETLDAARGSVVLGDEGKLAVDEGTDNRDPRPSPVENRDTVRNKDDEVSTSRPLSTDPDAEGTPGDLDAAKGSVHVDPDNRRALTVDEGTDRREPRPSPVENRDRVLNQSDAASSDDSAFLASLDDEEREVVTGNKAAYMVGNFDTSVGGTSVLDSLAYPSKAAVRAAELSGRRAVDVGDAADTTGDELVGGETRRTTPAREESAATETDAARKTAETTAQAEKDAPRRRSTTRRAADDKSGTDTSK